MKANSFSMRFGIGLILILTIFTLMPDYSFAMRVEKGKLYFVGVGPAGPDMATLQAIDVIKQADVIFAPKYIQEAFHEYLRGKEVLLAWPESVYMVDGKPYTTVDSEDGLKRMARAGMEHAASLSEQFKKEMSQGKSVALLVNGDPCLFSDLRWFKKFFSDDEFEVIPGMSSFNAGAALFKVDLTQPRGLNTVIIHSPIAGVSEIRKLAKHQATMVFFMAGNLKMVVKELKREYDEDTQIAVAYFIGYPDKQKVIKGTLETIVDKTAHETEKEMLLIYVGNFMK
jgi:precorrin-4 methylase